ncbi:MAG: hypothetical protein ACRD1T_13055, partial [Acidimicrobiia bacterium]
LWTVRASTELDTPGLAEANDLELILRVEESIDGAPSGSDPPVLTVTLRPQSLKEGHAERSPGTPLTLRLKVDELGRIRSLQTSEIPATSLQALELDRLVTEFRPVLPAHAIAIGDTWPAGVRVDGSVSQIRLDGEGRLEAFRLKAGRRLAVIRIERSGTVVTTQAVGRAQVQLPGTVTSNTTAEIDTQRGGLYSAVTRSVTQFTLSGQGSGLAGRFKVVIDMRVELT